MKTVCIYHSIDLDGWMSAAIVKHWWKEQNKSDEPFFFTNDSTKDELLCSNGTLKFIGYNYGQPIPDLSEYDKVIICDVSFPKEKMLTIASCLNIEFIWLDHHISAIKEDDYTEEYNVKGIRDTNFAACELTWSYFFPNKPMPEIVRLLGRYDCFGHKGTDEETSVLEFQYGARSCISNYEEAYTYLLYSFQDNKWQIENISKNGKVIYQYLCTEAKQTYKNGFEIRFTEDFGQDSWIRKFICINKERFNPINFGIDYHKDGYDGCACFHYANGLWNFSLYNDNGLVDCSAIAKQFGGGGHKGAAGFKVNMYNFLEIIK